MNDVEIKNFELIAFISKIIIKIPKNSFEELLVESIESINNDVIIFNNDIKIVRSNWWICHSEKQQEAIKTNKYLLEFLEDIQKTFNKSEFTKIDFEKHCFNF